MSIVSDVLASVRRPPRVEYLPPEGSTATEPPYGTDDVRYWMVFDGQRVQRHRRWQDGFAGASSRRRIFVAAAAWLAFGVLVIGLMGLAVMAALWALPSMAGLVVAILIAGIWVGALAVPGSVLGSAVPRFCRNRDISADEGHCGMFIVVSPVFVAAVLYILAT